MVFNEPGFDPERTRDLAEREEREDIMALVARIHSGSTEPFTEAEVELVTPYLSPEEIEAAQIKGIYPKGRLH